MFAKVKSTVFIDKLRLYLSAKTDSSLRAVLKDDKGSICSSLETVMPNKEQHEWNGRDLITCLTVFIHLNCPMVLRKCKCAW
jgi:hypothetical protein